MTITTINYATVFKFLSQTKNIDYARRWLTFIGFPYEDEKLKLFFGCQHSDKSIRKLKITVDELEYDMFETFQLSARFLVLKDREAVWQSILEEIQDALPQTKHRLFELFDKICTDLLVEDSFNWTRLEFCNIAVFNGQYTYLL